jgi:hypothetical protein
MYFHFSNYAPFRFENDGLLDIRLVYSRHVLDNFTYPAAKNARSPFVHLGVNRCGASTPGAPGGWCNYSNGILHFTSFDTSAMYMASGFLPSPNGEEVYFYANGQPFTHGGDGDIHTWGDNSGIRLVKIRRDGFMSIDAPYVFNLPLGLMPTVKTVALDVPKTCRFDPSGFTGGVELRVNFRTSVAGFLAVAVEQAQTGRPNPRFDMYTLDQSDLLRGNAMGAVASWGNRTQMSLSPLAGERIRIAVVLTDAKLYSLSLVCADNDSENSLHF